MSDLIPIAWDTETHLIGPGSVLPRLVCASFAWRNEQGVIETKLLGNSPADDLEGFLRELLLDPRYLLVTHTGQFDYGTVMAFFPDLIPAVFTRLVELEVTDTVAREKLINLSTHGKLTLQTLPDGSTKDIRYNLAVLVKQYLKQDISADKEGDDIWRLNYSALDGWEARDYPAEAAAYACDDARFTLQVYEQQALRVRADQLATVQTEAFQLAAAVALQLMTAWGMEVNPEEVDLLEAACLKIHEENDHILVDAGLLTPGSPEAPMMRNGKAVLDRKAMKAAGTKEPIVKMRQAQKPKANTKALQEHVVQVFRQLGQIPEETDSSTPEKRRYKVDAEVQKRLAPHCPIMQAYRNREEVKKLVTQQIPVFRSGPVVHFNYDVLKETGRTSSYGNSKGRPALYPATNGQQVPGIINGLDPRACYRPRAGTCFFDVDVTGLELACVGQVTYNLFGASVHKERYNQGVDLHGYLGSALAVGLADGIGAEFAEECRTAGILGDPLAVYEAFMELKKSDTPELKAFWKHYRTFAKPVGLGFPGGLGPATMVDFAWATYGIRLDQVLATTFREMWFEVYPEMRKFLKDYIPGQVDHHNGRGGDTLYHYTTPLGMVRRGASFCAAANGECMQSPGAEGMKMAMIMLQRACYDPTQESILYGCRPIAFVHDQVIGETTRDPELWHDQCMEVGAIIQKYLKAALPDMLPRTDEAHLTGVWSKASVPTFGPDGRLTPWTPTTK